MWFSNRLMWKEVISRAMKSKGDAIQYYSRVECGRPYIADIIRNMEEQHDFDKQPLIEPNSQLDGAFLAESARYLGASILQFLAHNYLERAGYITWAEVTRYYSRYFSILSFIRLSGYATLRIRHVMINEPELSKQYWVIRLDEDKRSYFIGQNKHTKTAHSTLPIKIPGGNVSHTTNWLLMAEIGKSWDRTELDEAQILSPEISTIAWSSYEKAMTYDFQRRCEWNYLTDMAEGFFFGELDGLHIWRDDGLIALRLYANPLSEHVPMEDTWEYKMTWGTIVFLFSILAKTLARREMEFVLGILAKAPANEQMKTQMLEELRSKL